MEPRRIRARAITAARRPRNDSRRSENGGEEGTATWVCTVTLFLRVLATEYQFIFFFFSVLFFFFFFFFFFSEKKKKCLVGQYSAVNFASGAPPEQEKTMSPIRSVMPSPCTTVGVAEGTQVSVVALATGDSATKIRGKTGKKRRNMGTTFRSVPGRVVPVYTPCYNKSGSHTFLLLMTTLTSIADQPVSHISP